MKMQQKALCSLLLAAALVAVPAFSQEPKSEPSAPPAAGSEDGKKPGDKLDAKELVPASETAESLRRKGTIVSQSGELNIAVDNNFYDKLPGFKLDGLSEGQRDWLLKRANAVFCTCGCKGDTIARCVATDPTCETARDMFSSLMKKATAMSEEELAAARAAARESAEQDEE